MAPAAVSKSASTTEGRNRVVNVKDSLPKTKKKQRNGEVVCESDDDVCVISPIVVLKKKCDMSRYEKREECFILDFDPFEVTAVVNKAKQIDEDVAVVSEKGQVRVSGPQVKVACRDYPHSRHLCLEFPFDKTLHESYCKLCYCYVCDTAAPCKYWKMPLPVDGHCHAVDHIAKWKQKRELTKKTAKLNSS